MNCFALYRIEIGIRGRRRWHGHDDCVRWHGRAGVHVLEVSGIHLFGSVYTAGGVDVGSGGVRSRGGGGLVMVRQASGFSSPFRLISSFSPFHPLHRYPASASLLDTPALSLFTLA